MGFFELPERTFTDTQSITNKPQMYKRCECGAIVYVGDSIWTINDEDYCKECLEEGINNCKREVW
jgi:predicted ATP-grasp superfamily ATP-dependent carboligase